MSKNTQSEPSHQLSRRGDLPPADEAHRVVRENLETFLAEGVQRSANGEGYPNLQPELPNLQPELPNLLKEGDAVRALAMSALLEAFARHSGEVRRASETAILLVDAPGTQGAIARARAGAPAELRAALDRLADRVAHSPLRPRAVQPTP